MVNNCPGLGGEYDSLTVIKYSVDVGSQEPAVSNIANEESMGESVYEELYISIWLLEN